MAIFKSATRQAVSETLALVLAGGRGDRLQCLTDRQAKPALPFGAKYRVIDFPLSNCINSGIRKVGVATQYRAHDLIQHVQRTWGFLRHELGEFVEVWPAQQQTPEGGWYAGTADAAFQNIDLIRRHRPRHVLILAGDHVYKQDYGTLIAEHVARCADVTVSCVSVPKDEARRFGIVTVDGEERISSFVEKPGNPVTQPDDSSRCLVSMGIYLFNTEVLLAALKADARSAGSKRDFGADLIPSLIDKTRMFAHQFARSCVSSRRADEPYWRDVGTLDSFWQANMDLVAAQPAFDLYDRDWPIWTHQEQRPPAKLVFEPTERLGMVSATMIAEGCVVTGATVRRSQLFSDVRVDRASVIEDSVLLPACEIRARTRISRAILAPGCIVPEGTVIGEDLSDDRARFQVTGNGVTVVTPRMLERLRDAPDREIRVAKAAQRALAAEQEHVRAVM